MRVDSLNPNQAIQETYMFPQRARSCFPLSKVALLGAIKYGSALLPDQPLTR